MAANASAAMEHFDPQLALVLKDAELPLEGQMPFESMKHKLSSAFVPPTLTAFTSRLRMPMDDGQEIIAGRAGRGGDTTDDDNKSGNGGKKNGKAASNGDSNTQAVAINVIASVFNANECAIEDSDDEGDEKKNDKNPGESSSAIANSDEDWEDEDGASYNANGTAVIKTAVAIRRRQLQPQNKYQRYLRQKKLPTELEGPQVYDSKGHLIIIGLPVNPARNPDGSLVSNLSLQLRRQAEEMDAASSNNSLAGSAASSRRSSRGALPAPHGSPFTTGNPQFPDPLRCHPALVTPPLTPPYHGAQSPEQPPPAPPSTPYSPPPSRFTSNMSLQAALTPPMSPSTAMVSMATAVATILSSTSSSSSISTASDTGSTSGTAPSTSPDTASSTNTTNGVVMSVTQAIGSFRPFGNSTLQAVINATSNAGNNNNNGLGMRPTLVRSASSHLLGAELSKSLRNHIMEENNSRHRFNQYGPRHRLTGGSQAGPSTSRPPTIIEKDEDVYTTALSPPPIQRTRSAPSVTQTTYHIATLEESCKGKGKAVMHNGFRDQPPPRPEFDLTAKFAKNECYEFAHGYHAKGW